MLSPLPEVTFPPDRYLDVTRSSAHSRRDVVSGHHDGEP